MLNRQPASDEEAGTRGIILIHAMPGMIGQAYADVIHLGLQADAVTGPYDVIAEGVFANPQVLGEFVLERIQTMPSVQRALPSIVVDHAKHNGQTA